MYYANLQKQDNYSRVPITPHASVGIEITARYGRQILSFPFRCYQITLFHEQREPGESIIVDYFNTNLEETKGKNICAIYWRGNIISKKDLEMRC